jgi:hypothetical protein
LKCYECKKELQAGYYLKKLGINAKRCPEHHLAEMQKIFLGLGETILKFADTHNIELENRDTWTV